MREDYALCFFVELDYFELECLAELCLAAVFLNKVFWSSEAFNTAFECDYSTLVEYFSNFTFVYSVLSELCFECIPWVVFKLLVTE